MLSPQSSFRLGWDIFIAVVLAYVAIVEPLALGFSGFRHLTRQGLPLGIINRIVDVIFICDLLLNFRTGYIDDRNQLVLEPRKSSYHYLTTWFPLDFVSSTVCKSKIQAPCASARWRGDPPMRSCPRRGVCSMA